MRTNPDGFLMDTTVLCGVCNLPAAKHHVEDEIETETEDDFDDDGNFVPGYKYVRYCRTANCCVCDEEVQCTRSLESVNSYELRGYWRSDYNADFSPVVDYSGYEPFTTDAWAIEPEYSPNIEGYSDGKYRHECTTLLGDHFAPELKFRDGTSVVASVHAPFDAVRENRHGQARVVVEPEVRNRYLPGNSGVMGLSIKVYDLETTRNYHKRLLNIFVDGDSRLRVGSVYFERSSEEATHAYCVRANCDWHQTVLLSNSEHDRRQMEDFVYEVIRHGNNHGHSWLLSGYRLQHHSLIIEGTARVDDAYRYVYPNRAESYRYLHDFTEGELVETWYKLHARMCRDVAECNDVAGDKAGCLPPKTQVVKSFKDLTPDFANGVRREALTADETREFLREHASLCKDPACTCSVWNSLRPAKRFQLLDALEALPR